MNSITEYLLGQKKTRFRFNNYTILMIGLSGSGKTSILNLLTNFKIEEAIPSDGCNKDIVKYDNYNFTILDVSGQEHMVPMWKNFYNNIDGIIYVMDGSDQSKYEINKKTLYDVLNAKEISNLPIVVLANKCDICKNNLQNIQQLTEYLNLSQQNEQRPWDIRLSSIYQGGGISEGLDFLRNNIPQANK